MKGREFTHRFEHAAVNGTGVVEDRPHSNLENLGFSRGGRGGKIGGGGLGSFAAVYRGGVDGRGFAVLDARGSDPSKEGRNVARIGEGDRAGIPIMVNSVAKEGGSNGVGFDVVDLGEVGVEVVKIRPMMILHTEVINDEGEVKISGVVAEKHRGVSGEESTESKMRDEAFLG